MSIHPNGKTSTAGRRFNVLSAVTIGMMVAFVGGVLVLLLTGLSYTTFGDVVKVLISKPIRAALQLSIITSGTTVVLVTLCAVPVGYALSRYRFPGHAVADTVIDLPIILPPLVVGVSLLVFFSTPLGRWIENHGMQFVYTPQGIVLCQFLVSAPYGIRAAKSAFDSVDQRLEDLALTLGCTHVRAFREVAFPLARNGIVAGCVMSWARAVGIFGPLMIFAGTVRFKTEVLPTTIFLELSIGRIEVANAVAIVMMYMAGIALVLIHWLASGPALRAVLAVLLAMTLVTTSVGWLIREDLPRAAIAIALVAPAMIGACVIASRKRRPARKGARR